MFGKLIVLLLIGVIAVGLVARTTHGAGPERAYLVKPTDTLWSIAARTYAGDPREGVWEIQQRNHLAVATITPGEKLVLP